MVARQRGHGWPRGEYRAPGFTAALRDRAQRDVAGRVVRIHVAGVRLRDQSECSVFGVAARRRRRFLQWDASRRKCYAHGASRELTIGLAAHGVQRRAPGPGQLHPRGDRAARRVLLHAPHHVPNARAIQQSGGRVDGECALRLARHRRHGTVRRLQ